MSKGFITGNTTSECLLERVEEYVAFVCRVLHDEAFLVELQKTMPFDKMVHAAMDTGRNGGRIRRMGISVMRMDVEPSLFSLAVTIMFRGVDGMQQNHSIFINACKTIEELQHLAAEEDFKTEVTTLCRERL